jgi:maltose alpha-D-glucosyltransferase/alpha-amylase
MPAWLSDAVFYEVYPQSFRDTNGDGIGDIEGIASKLDYIRSLGCNAVWINPCFVSPFKDGGYDVANYRTVAPRYGKNEDQYRHCSPGRMRQEYASCSRSEHCQPGPNAR